MRLQGSQIVVMQHKSYKETEGPRATTYRPSSKAGQPFSKPDQSDLSLHRPPLQSIPVYRLRQPWMKVYFGVMLFNLVLINEFIFFPIPSTDGILKPLQCGDFCGLLLASRVTKANHGGKKAELHYSLFSEGAMGVPQGVIHQMFLFW